MILGQSTADARRAMQLANQEAMRSGMPYIGTEHVLVGLAEAGGYVSEILAQHGATPRELRAEIARLSDENGTKPQGAEAPLKKIIEYALDETQRRNHNHMDTGHILLAILRVASCRAVAVLRTICADLEQIEHQVVSRLPVPTFPLSAAHERFKDHPRVRELSERRLAVQREMEQAVARVDFLTAAKGRDLKVQIQTELERLLEDLWNSDRK